MLFVDLFNLAQPTHGNHLWTVFSHFQGIVTCIKGWIGVMKSRLGSSSGVGSLVGPGVCPTLATSKQTSLKHIFLSNHTLYYCLACLTRRGGDSRVHRLLPNLQAVHTTVHLLVGGEQKRGKSEIRRSPKEAGDHRLIHFHASLKKQLNVNLR